MLTDAGILLIAILALVKSASYAVKSIINVAKYFRMSEFFITFFIAGLISIAPELFIGINSALVGATDIGLGTLIGSNIADLTIIVGVVALVGRKIPISQSIIKNDLHFLAATSAPVLLLLDGSLSRMDGLFLVLIFLVYMYYSFRNEKVFSNAPKKEKEFFVKNLAVFIFSMSVLFVSSHFIVSSALELFDALYIPPIIAGLFLISIGTTLPELTFSLKAVLAKHKQIALGDILGNVAIDSTLSIGIIALISPITTNFTVFAISALFMSFAALLVVTLFTSGKKITWNERFLLFFLYALFVIIHLKNILGG